MGILRKYLWLVLPIIFFANCASADTCKNDPYACTPAKLCSKTTEKINNVLYWISSEEDKHLKVARKINLNCGAKDAMSSCQKDASECSILELCEVAATKEVSAINWNEINPQHVKLAKSFGLDCGVKETQGINQVNKTNTNKSMSLCDLNPASCISEELCERATYTINRTTNWKVGAYKKYVKEAKQRGLSCGLNTTSIDKTCSQDVYKCTPTELCDAATYTINKITEWKVGAYKKYVKEAKRRNISCGVKSASNDQVKADEKARLALKTEKKRKADEKARLALAAEKKRKADEKARLALVRTEAEKNLTKLVSGDFSNQEDRDRYGKLTSFFNQTINKTQDASYRICTAAQNNKKIGPVRREAICSDMYYGCTINRYNELLEVTKKESGFGNMGILSDMLVGVSAGALIIQEDCYKLAIQYTKNSIQLGYSGLYIRLEDLKSLSGMLNSQNTNTGVPNQMKFNDLQIRDPLNLKRYD